jgi:hypothetical protein
MIGRLPKSLEVNGKSYAIRSDFRDCLLILQAFGDPELSDYERMMVMLKCLYVDDIPDEDVDKAIEQAVWFLNCGDSVGNAQSSKQLYDFEHDEHILFASLNHVAGKEIRLEEYMHFWTFIGLFNEIGEGTFSTVVQIRSKKNKGKKLEKYEQEFYQKNKAMIDLPKKYTEKEKEENEKLLSIF